jgi:hypothetical protein
LGVLAENCHQITKATSLQRVPKRLLSVDSMRSRQNEAKKAQMDCEEAVDYRYVD